MINNYEIFIPIFTIAILWGIQPIFIKKILKSCSKVHLIGYSTFFYLLFGIIYILYISEDKFETESLNYDIILFISLYTILCLLIPNILLTHNLNDMDAGWYNTLTTILSVIFTIFFAYHLLNEKINYNMMLGVILIILGLVIVARYS
jgi:drug/metabolite transporter (DMT)-like permease